MHTPFEPVVEQHGATVLRVCRAVLGAGADAEDAWSATFLSALTAWPDANVANVEAWLVTIANRKALDVVRSRQRRPVPTDVLPERAAPSSAENDPGARDLDLWTAVAALPERQRLAVAYHFIGGLPHAETAELIGGSASSVRRASADGVARLRETLREVDDE